MKVFVKNSNPEPWKISLDNRLERLINNTKKNAVYIYEAPDTSTFRYRAYNMCQSLELSSSWTGIYFFEYEIKQLEKYLDKIDVCIFVRTRWSINFQNFLKKIECKNIPTVFDCDDLVFDVTKIPLIMNTLNVDFDHKNYQYWFAYISRIWLMASKCDCSISTNEFLGKRLADCLRKPNFVINNFLNNEQIEFSNGLFSKRVNTHKRKGLFKIGYFSGTPSHINDFKQVSNELYRLLRAYPSMVLEIVGYMEVPQIFNDMVKNKRVRHTPLVDFLTLQEKISEVDVNIIPLVNNEFTNCKSELKFFEAAIVGTTTCATPTYVYKNNIKEGKTGFLCEVGGWYSIIENIYKNGVEKSITQDARKYCLDKYSPSAQTANVESVLNDIIKKTTKYQRQK